MTKPISSKVKSAGTVVSAIAKCQALGGVETKVGGLRTFIFIDGSRVQFAYCTIYKIDTWNMFDNAEQQTAHLEIYKGFYK